MEFSEQAIAQALEMAQSPAGQALMRKLEQTLNPTQQAALKQAAAGDMSQAREMLPQLLSSPEIRALLRQLGK